MKNCLKRWIQGCILLIFLCFCQAAAANGSLYQVSLLSSLMQGYYEGSATVGDLLSHGNTGIGTFNALDGEMIVLDGVVYKATVDGRVTAQPDQEGVAFAVVTDFKPSFAVSLLPQSQNIEEMKLALDEAIVREKKHFNSFYVVRIDGVFDAVHVRSVEKQAMPYRPLSQVAQDQKEFTYRNLKGTIVAVRCPDFAEGMNVASWHLHFISADRKKGGHLLDAKMKTGSAGFDVLNQWYISMPDASRFGELDLAKDLSEETRQVESKRP